MVRFYGRQSSMAPEGATRDLEHEQEDGIEYMSDTIELLCHASKGDVAQVEALLAKGLDVNSSDFDKRTALHVAACEGMKQVVELLLARGANVNAADRWGSTPLQDARHYKWDEVSQVLEAHGGKLPETSPMLVSDDIQVPEYEVNPAELTFPLSDKQEPHISGKWRGTKVFVKIVALDNEETTKEFLNELSLMLKLRHPNIVQFLGAVTQSVPVMIIFEFLPRGDLGHYLEKKGVPLKPKKALKFAFDIARGLNYVHSFKPDPVVHKNLKPSNLLRDKAGHLKITDFAFPKSADDVQRLIQSSGRYMAPELYRGEIYGTKIDVFSFALIVQEMMEGVRPFDDISSSEDVAKAYAQGSRPPFKIRNRYYPHGLKELIEKCWQDDPANRPTFNEVIKKLEEIKRVYMGKTFKGFITSIRYSKIFGR